MSPESGVDTSWNRETRDLYARLIEAWDKRDARDYALQFTSDASLVGFDGTQVKTNRRIARFLDERHPDPPLFPVGEAQRAAVEEAERWGDEVFQMVARRLALVVVFHFDRAAGDGNGCDSEIRLLKFG